MGKLKPKSRKTKVENTALSTFVSVQLFSLVCYIAVFLILSFIALVADVPQGYDYYFSALIFVICSFLTGFYAGIRIRQNGLVAGIIFSLPMNTLVVILSLIFADFKADAHLFITALLLIISSAIGGVIAVNKRHKR